MAMPFSNGCLTSMIITTLFHAYKSITPARNAPAMTPNVAETFEALPVKDLTGAHSPVCDAGETGLPVLCATPDQLAAEAAFTPVAAPAHEA